MLLKKNDFDTEMLGGRENEYNDEIGIEKVDSDEDPMDTAKRMKMKGFRIEDIEAITGLSKKDIQNLKN